MIPYLLVGFEAWLNTETQMPPNSLCTQLPQLEPSLRSSSTWGWPYGLVRLCRPRPVATKPG